MGNLICERWKRNPQTVYLGLLSLLTGELAPVPEKHEGEQEDEEDTDPEGQPLPNQQSFLKND